MKQTGPVSRRQISGSGARRAVLAVQLRYRPRRADVGRAGRQVVLLPPGAGTTGGRSGTGTAPGTHDRDGMLVDGHLSGLLLQRTLDGRCSVQVGHALANLGCVQLGTVRADGAASSSVGFAAPIGGQRIVGGKAVGRACGG